MITSEHLDHYRSFGFVVLRRQLDDATTAALSAEVDSAFRDAFGAAFDDRPERGGIEGHYLPVMSRARTPTSLQLVERLHPVARRLLGGEALPAPAQAILFFDQAAWHADTGFGVEAVKFACYLEPLRADTGALRVLPGSQVEPYGELARRFDRGVMPQNGEELRVAVERLPAFVCQTDPGDAIAFDLRLYHASMCGRDRRQWSVTFYRDAETPEDAAELGRALLDEVEPGYGSWGEYDAARYPFYDPDWLAELAADWRASAARRLRELGVVDAAAAACGISIPAT